MHDFGNRIWILQKSTIKKIFFLKMHIDLKLKE